MAKSIEPVRFANVVNGASPQAAAVIDSFDPFTGTCWATIPRCNAAEVDTAVAAAKAAFRNSSWRDMSATQRGKLLARFADILEAEAEALALIESRDNGKLLAEMSMQVRYLPEWFRYFAGLCDKVEGTVLPIDKPMMHVFTRREPIGVVACITPWNSPLLLLGWKLAPALAAGNTVVIKPSEHASCSTLAFAALFEKAGFPPGVVNTITGFGNEAGARLSRHPDVAKVAFTGGEPGGHAVYRAAAEGLKKVSLELGGKSPNIVFDDAPLEKAIFGVIAGIFAASGQTCIAGSRLLVQRGVHDEVVERVVALAKKARLGNPRSSETQVGPVTTKDQLDKILAHIARAREAGARCVLGGGRPDDAALADGWFVEPTIFTHVTNTMPIAREEVFGPVLCVIPFDDEADAIAIANDCDFGLAAGIWTSDMVRALRMSERIEAGTVWVNMYRAVSFMAPFGGVKRSGIGRENGQAAMNEFLETKTVWIDMDAPAANPFVLR